MTSTKERFEAAVFVVQNLPKEGDIKTSVQEKLNFYGLYKQSTVGPCNVPKPSFWSVQEVYKWEAWNSLGELTSEDAMNRYVDILTEKIMNVKQTNPDFTKELAEGKDNEINKLLEPKLILLGLHEAGPAEVGNSSNSEADKKEDENKYEAESTTASVVEVASPQSDLEYADALDNDDYSRSSSFSRKRHPSSPTLASSCKRIQADLQNISNQIEQLSEGLEKQQRALTKLFKKATVYLVVPRQITWTQLFFFIIWPFVAHLIVKSVRRLFNFA